MSTTDKATPPATVRLGERYDIGADETDVTPVILSVDGYEFTADVFTDCVAGATATANKVSNAVNAHDALVALAKYVEEFCALKSQQWDYLQEKARQALKLVGGE